jgi:hypothetical protein
MVMGSFAMIAFGEVGQANEAFFFQHKAGGSSRLRFHNKRWGGEKVKV